MRLRFGSRRVAAWLLLPLVVVLAGCVRVEASFVIKDKDHVEVSYDFGLSKQLLERAGKKMSGEDVCNQDSNPGKSLPSSSKKQSYDDGSYVGCKISATLTAAELNSAEQSFSLKDGVWTFKIASGGRAQQQLPSGVDLSKLGGGVKFSVTFPGEVLTHNGNSTVLGTTVTWTGFDDLMKSEGLQATGKDKKSPADLGFMIIGIAIGAIVMIGIAMLIYFLVRRARKAAAQPAAPGYPNGFAPPTGFVPSPGQQPYQPQPYGSPVDPVTGQYLPSPGMAYPPAQPLMPPQNQVNPYAPPYPMPPADAAYPPMPGFAPPNPNQPAPVTDPSSQPHLPAPTQPLPPQPPAQGPLPPRS